MSTTSWSTTGNAGTSEDKNFIGTTDAQPFVIRTAGSRRIRIDSQGTIWIGAGKPIVGYKEPVVLLKVLQNMDNTGLVLIGQGIHSHLVINGDLTLGPSPVANWPPKFSIDKDGNVGIGVANPTSSLHLASGKALRLEGSAANQDVNKYYFSLGGNGRFGIDAPGVPGGRFVVDDSGKVGIGITNPSNSLDVAGSATISGNLTVSGDIFLPGADCAEQFDISGSKMPDPGTVVVIDEGGALEESICPYDKRVAGIVSGAGNYRPGLLLDNRNDSEGRVAIALMGKVYCKVDAQYSPIQVGDLLTTSSTPGHAMRATDPLEAFGAVVGKALKPLTSGKGLIPVLVALQ